MNNKEELTFKDIKEKIYTIRDQKVMLDSDLAKIYGYEVKVLNRQVKRNEKRFPSDFAFRLNNDEFNNLKCQFGTSSWGGLRKLPYAFTEQGIYMLATVLRGELAEKQSIFLIRAFKQMKDYIYENRNLLTPTEEDKLLSVNVRLDNHERQLFKQDEKIDEISNQIKGINQNFIDDKVKEICIHKDEKFEAIMAYVSIVKEAKKTIYLIDDYINYRTLELLTNKKKDVELIIFTENKAKDKLTRTLFDNFNSEYPTLRIKPNKISHDSYFILDYKTKYEKIYNLGSSLKDGGSKLSSICQITNLSYYKDSTEELLSEEDVVLED